MSFCCNSTGESWEVCDDCQTEGPHVHPPHSSSGIGEAYEAARDASWLLNQWSKSQGEEQDFCPGCARKRGQA